MKMGKIITIKPVTRIEGHAKVNIYLDEEGNVKDSRLHIVELRGFEKFCVGRPVEEMPRLTSRICGICPVSHHLASAKACDVVFGVEIPEPAAKLRELMHMGQFINSHALHFFFLAAPDFVFGPDADPSIRNVVGIIRNKPEIAKKAIRARAIGQTIIKIPGGKAVHPVSAVPGGMSCPLSKEKRDELLKGAKEALEIAEFTIGFAKPIFESYMEEVKSLGVLESYYMGTVKNGGFELYDGPIRIMDASGKIITEYESMKYLDYVAEHVEPWTYLKFPYLKRVGWPSGIYRVAPLARINVAERMPTPKAQEELEGFRSAFGRPSHLTLLNHWARLIELTYATERAIELLEDDDILSENVRAEVVGKPTEGVGSVEAPRGTLFHHYKTDEDGFLVDVNILVATAQNYPAMNFGILESAKKLINHGKISEGILNRIEMIIRAYDPCLSCATHTIKLGQFPVEINVFDETGVKIRAISNISK